MSKRNMNVPLHLPPDIWQPLAEIRSQLDSESPGAPTPIEEALREIIEHYQHCPRTREEMPAFRERAKSWKQKRRV